MNKGTVSGLSMCKTAQPSRRSARISGTRERSWRSWSSAVHYLTAWRSITF